MQRYENYTRLDTSAAPAPNATITVYKAGTLTLATLYSDTLYPPTSKANPFTASSTGFFAFYAADGRYDVRISGGGIATPYTWGDIQLLSGVVAGVNVMDYGAVGDDTHDDYQAFVDAYAVAKARQVPLIIPPAVGNATLALSAYKITASLTWDGDVDVIGLSRGSAPFTGARIKIHNTDPSLTSAILITSPEATYSGFILDSIGHAAGARNSGIVINASGAGLRLQDVSVISQGSRGIVISSMALGNFCNVSVAGNYNQGIYAVPSGGGFVTANNFSMLNVSANGVTTGASGIHLENTGAGVLANNFYQAVCQDNGGYGIYCDALTNKFDAYCESNILGDYLFDTNSVRNFLTLMNQSHGLDYTKDKGLNNWIFNFALNVYQMRGGIGAGTMGTNIAGANFSVGAASAGAGATAHAGGTLTIGGGDAGGTAGNANGGGVTVSGGTKANSGADGFVQVQGNATGPLGFYGVTPVTRQVFATGAAHTVDQLITVLQNLGLISQT